MLALASLVEELAAHGLPEWREELRPLLEAKLADGAHGDLPKWREALAALPRCRAEPAELDRPVIAVCPTGLRPADREVVRELLQKLSPWRKGPFQIGDILIDAEWRSDLKWARIENRISPLAGRLVLDVGCGNGYYALRMRGMGARAVVGIEPMLLYVAQHVAIRHFMQPEPVYVMPLRLQELPPAEVFDTAFSMGVLYHQREPRQHLEALLRMLKDDGELVLETLILPGELREARTPQRYARMKNVWLLPTRPLLLEWLQEAGFDEARIESVSATTNLEQRRTEWMRFDSLAEALDPQDPSTTVEGWPAPQRALVIARKPARKPP
ncbi:MAG TPA: tRNA 5-methoxyuridine(34)/uridine 5-oxyacetic acid(34) synthase CmoB [Woeseiaceae bacterium]|nr:tRNA 5-methoxyuridine(34)/uridine 5-oxyacetic acid(34) synthase CmoB [Woeseiaceae bacterium]